MPVFTYQAKDLTGETITGTLNAENERAAAGQVRELGYYPMRVAKGGVSAELGMVTSNSPVQTYSADPVLSVNPFFRNPSAKVKAYGSYFEQAVIFPIWSGVNPRDLALFYRQLATMLNAGMNISRSLQTVKTASSGMIRIMAAKMGAHVEAGGELSEAMQIFPHIFSKMQISIVRASEQTGALDVMMNRLSDYLEADFAMRQMIKKETFMPKINFVATFLIPTLVVAVVHGTQAYFQTAVLPLLQILFFMGAAWGIGRYSLTVKPIAIAYDTIKAHLPYFGTTVRMLALAKFSRAFASLYSSGVSIPTAVQTCAEVSGNEYLGYMMGKAVPAMQNGMGLTEAFAQTGVFPPMFLSMMGTGETTGGLDVMLDKVAEFYEAESAVRLHQSVNALSILFFLMIAAFVGFTVIKFYMESYGGPINDLLKFNP